MTVDTTVELLTEIRDQFREQQSLREQIADLALKVRHNARELWTIGDDDATESPQGPGDASADADDVDLLTRQLSDLSGELRRLRSERVAVVDQGAQHFAHILALLDQRVCLTDLSINIGRLRLDQIENSLEVLAGRLRKHGGLHSSVVGTSEGSGGARSAGLASPGGRDVQ